jgi:DNA-binding CsgD family transcriptional regulator
MELNMTATGKLGRLSKKMPANKGDRTLWIGLALSTVCTAFFAIDVAGDMLFDGHFPGGNLHHLLEIFVVIVSASALTYHVFEISKFFTKHEKISNQMRVASGEFADVLEELFATWQLTPAERDVAMLLVKGVGFKELADLRNAKEGTVKAQANAIYRKAGVSGRHELVALFLDELLQQVETSP